MKKTSYAWLWAFPIAGLAIGGAALAMRKKPAPKLEPINQPTSNTALPAAGQAPASGDCAGRRFIIVADSLGAGNNTPIAMLAQKLTACGAKVALNAKSGRSAIAFNVKAELDKLARTIEKLNPTDIVIALGTNDIFKDRAKTIKAYTNIFAYCLSNPVDCRVWWIGPPAFSVNARAFGGGNLRKEEPAFIEAIKSVIGNGEVRFIDSVPLTDDIVSTKYRSKDLIHFKESGAAIWADRLYGDMIE